ncbi:amidohydrolase family protein [Streptomyces gilvus]|uniref:amidohydrolase family protein n=1 Tax=Streptomyces gilvus TaxID=2920937 RepID=UPI001F0D4EB5|nr:amidohydrolase family protein [Streptomyces sp. CME 23]MCH5670844.1 amidohydrolase [Streptomyces sp. CME 23]
MFIDIHGHLSPPGEKGGGPPSLRDPEAVIARKRALGIELTVIGSPVGAGVMLPLPDIDNYRQTADQVRAHNELMAELVDRHPQSLRTYAYLDPTGDERMLTQAQELLKDWRFVGFVVNSSINDEYLSSPRAEQFFAMASELAVPVLLHPPARPVGAASLGDFGMVEHVGRFNDVTAGLAALLRAGAPQKYPGLVLVAAAGGGAVAQLAEKLDLAAVPRGGGEPEFLPSEGLRRIHVDTSCPSPHNLAANLAVLGADRVLFGTDAPPLMEALEPTLRLVTGAGLSAADLDRVTRLNALELYGLQSSPTPVS